MHSWPKILLSSLLRNTNHSAFVRDEAFTTASQSRSSASTSPQAYADTTLNATKVYAYLPHADTPLDSYHPAFWTFCFPLLFPWGDGLDGSPRQTFFSDHHWGKHLLLRRDRAKATHWRTDLDFVAVLFSVLHRRRLLRAVRAKLRSPTFVQAIPTFCNLQAVDFSHVAATIGELLGYIEIAAFSLRLDMS